MQKRNGFKTPISLLMILTLFFQFFSGMVLPSTTVQAAGTDIYSTAANQPLDQSDPLDVILTKPFRGSTVTKSDTTGTITIELPYGTFYQMLHPVVHAGSTVNVYESDETEIDRLTGINHGDYELGLKDSQGNRIVPGWTGGTYYLDVTNGQDTRRYTITVTIQEISDFIITRSLQDGGTEAVNKPGEFVAPMNIRANEHGMDTWGSTYIGYGDTGLNSVEAPMKPSSYSGRNWYDSYWGPDVYVHTENDINKFKPAGVSNDLSKDEREIPFDWYGDNMYIQTIAKDNSDGRIDAYGVDVKYDGTMSEDGKISGFDKLQSDIIRIHKFDAPAAAPGHEDGDRGAASSTTQRLEMKTNYTSENVIANDGPGTITTHFWRLLVPSETVKRQKQVGDNGIGSWSPNSYGYIYQIKEAKGNANGSPTVAIGLRANGTLSFEHSRNNSTPSGMQSAGGTDTGTFLKLEQDEFVDRWIDIELTTETADFGHLYVKVSDTETGELLGEGTLEESDLLRRNTELQLPERLQSPAPAPVYREGNYNTLKDDEGNNINFGRSKWGIYGSFPATGISRQEWQPSTIYMADITIIKRDRDTYEFPNGYKPTERDSNLSIVGWEHQNQMKVSLGTKVTDLTLKDELDVTLSNGFTVKVPVEWDTSGYRPTVPGTYRILGELQPPDGITIPEAPDVYYPNYYKPYFEINNSTVHDWGKAVMGANMKIVSHNVESPKENVLEEDRTAMTTSEGYAFFQSGSSFELDAGRTPWRYWVALDLGQQIDISRIEIEFGTMGSPGRSRNSSAWWTNDSEAYESLIESYNNFYNPLDPALAGGQPEPDHEFYEANNWPTKNPLGVENLVGYNGPWNYFEGSGRQPANINSQSSSPESNWNPLTEEALKGGTLGTNYTLGRRGTDVLANNDGQPITARYVMVVNELNFFSSVIGPPGSIKGSSPGPMQFLDFAVIGELHDELADLMVLETLTVGGVPVTEFNPNTKNYTLDVTVNGPIPIVAATLNSASIAAGAEIDIIQATDVEKTAVVQIRRTGGKDVFYLVNLNEVGMYDLTVEASPIAGGTVSGGGAYEADATVTLTATANSGYTFTNWTVDGSEVSTAESFSYMMPEAATTIIANFTLDEPTGNADQDAVNAEVVKYSDTAKIAKGVKTQTDVTNDIIQLIADQEADADIALSYVVSPGTYVEVVGGQLKLKTRNATSSNKTETVTITFDKNGKTAMKDVTVTIETSYVPSGGGILQPEIPVEPEKPIEPEMPVGPEKPSVKFTDTAGHWAKDAIEAAIARNLVDGYPDKTFKPENPMTRAEFITIIVRGLGLTGSGSALSFTDNNAIGDWAEEAIAIAIEAGLITGYTDGSFRPNDNISRAEMAMIIARALGIVLEAIEHTDFSDDSKIPGWAKAAVSVLKELKIIEGRGGNNYDPNANATRAESIVMVLRMLDLEVK